MPHTEIFMAYLPDSQDYSDKKILGFIKAENKALNALMWQIMRKVVTGQAGLNQLRI